MSAKLLAVAMALTAVLASAPALAQEALQRWALRSGDSTLMILELRPVRGSAGQWQGSIRRPAKIQISAGAIPTLTVDDPRLISERVSATDGEGGLLLSSTNERGEETKWRLKIAGERARLEMADVPPGAVLSPLRLARSGEHEQVSADLGAGSRFMLFAHLTSNAEMKAIFTADQADRQAGLNIDWTAVGPRDVARRARTAELLQAGSLQSGDDFWHAAFVFQHGQEPADYLLAHTLAVIAAARGRPDATWIAAATLDRYLQNIGNGQIYGTQFSTFPGKPTTQEPYNRTLVSDALREALGVPAQAAQEVRRKEIEDQSRAEPPRRKP